MSKNRVYNCDCGKKSLVITDVSNDRIIYKCDESACEFRKVINLTKKKKTMLKKRTEFTIYTKKNMNKLQEIQRNILLFEANPLVSKFQEIEFQLKEQNVEIFDHKKETIRSFIQRIKKYFN